MAGKDNEIILVTRADDMGYTHSGNLGTMECLRAGFIRSAAILAIAPWFEEAAQLARENPEFCFGVHMGIIGEWRGYRWRPVLPYSEIPTLVDEDGFLWRSPAEFWANHPKMEELEKEFTAQVALAQKKGVRVEYLDTHYIMPYEPRIRPVVENVAKKFKVPVSCLLGERELPDFGVYSAPPDEKVDALVRVLEGLEPGVSLLIAHPGFSSVENDALVHTEPTHVQAVGVGRNRAAETLAYTSPRIQKVIADRRIKVLSYREFCASLQ
jgi:predicted glycoside hydrolase/deacetylase ChbG (UPF0249 family)